MARRNFSFMIGFPDYAQALLVMRHHMTRYRLGNDPGDP
jgi:hypothetical protein